MPIINSHNSQDELTHIEQRVLREAPLINTRYPPPEGRNPRLIREIEERKWLREQLSEPWD